MLFKDSVRSGILQSPFLQSSHLTHKAKRVIDHLGLKGINRIVIGKPNTLILITSDAVVKVPMDRLSAVRCRLNSIVLKRLAKTSISSFVPRLIDKKTFDGQLCYCETRIFGAAIDIPISKIDRLIIKAADFISGFHKETAHDIIVNEKNFKKLFGRGFDRLFPHLDDEYKTKLLRIKTNIKQKVIGKPFKTVWSHGDYKIENILFDTKTWRIKGVIDWDMSRKEGLPLLDILYLIIYGKYTLTRKETIDVFKNQFLDTDLGSAEKETIAQYLDFLDLPEDLIQPMLVMFFLQHITVRFGQTLMEGLPRANEQFRAHICDIVDAFYKNCKDDGTADRWL